MFEEILALLLDEELEGYPNPDHLEMAGYSLEGEVAGALENLYAQYRYNSKAAERIEYLQQALEGFIEMTWVQMELFMETCGM